MAKIEKASFYSLFCSVTPHFPKHRHSVLNFHIVLLHKCHAVPYVCVCVCVYMLPPLNCLFACQLFNIILDINKLELSRGGPTCQPLALGEEALPWTELQRVF